MRSTKRGFLAAILLTAAAGFALSQEASAPPPPPAPDVAAPVAELPQLPVVSVPPVSNPNAPAVDPAVTIDPSVMAVAPATVSFVPAPEQDEPAATTTSRRVTRKSATKPVAKPEVEATESFGPVPAPAAAGTADPSTFQGLTPPNASANTAPAKSDATAPAAAKSAIPETPAESNSRSTEILGEWMLAGVLVVALFSIVTLLRRRRTQRRASMVDLAALAVELKPAPATPRL